MVHGLQERDPLLILVAGLDHYLSFSILVFHFNETIFPPATSFEILTNSILLTERPGICYEKTWSQRHTYVLTLHGSQELETNKN